MTIDTSPAALRALAEYWASDKPAGVDPDEPGAVDAIVSETDAKMAETVAALRALAAEKEAGARHWGTEAPVYIDDDPPPAPDGEPLRFTYRNYKGEIGERTVLPRSVRFGSTEWHPEPQWLMLAYDVDKQADREFAMRDMSPATPAPDGWIPWEGGECPVAGKTLVDVRFRPGNVDPCYPAEAFDWSHGWNDPHDDIIAYRIAKEG